MVIKLCGCGLREPRVEGDGGAGVVHNRAVVIRQCHLVAPQPFMHCGSAHTANRPLKVHTIVRWICTLHLLVLVTLTFTLMSTAAMLLPFQGMCAGICHILSSPKERKE
jgi:hypothetical protein